ncbi:NAD(P)-binding domain-containing protein [Nocardiopsis sp. CT-R113]|uniref:NAD(P)-binding domain-containing protein n=1 Tax=Nocardiopsis codii TaxID=3065942 RepID=A0ABU7KAG5_9ACTN|nr:NAD(P)-binding domain-containing protein [Nocardiopsis sp. CT-R113]MEE2039197.1 NAD(P)-binding domain-containing protein [Nocardiopsis sp. CT-R113]
METQQEPAGVTVIGLGPMGRAMAAAFLDRGHPVTVWNRTAARADGLVARGAVRAADVGEALAANEVVVLSLTDHAAMYALLGPAAPALHGRVIVNLGSDTPERAREAARWLTGHGAHHLTGGVQSDPSGIGSPGSSTFYSGPEEVFRLHRGTLRVLTDTTYLGEDPGLAALYYQLQMNLFWTSLLGWLQTLAMAGAHGITAADLLPHTETESLAAMFRYYSPRIDADDHTGGAERLSMEVASVGHVVATAAEAGVDTTLPSALLALSRRGLDAGYAESSFTSLVRILAKPSDARDVPPPAREVRAWE